MQFNNVNVFPMNAFITELCKWPDKYWDDYSMYTGHNKGHNEENYSNKSCSKESTEE